MRQQTWLWARGPNAMAHSARCLARPLTCLRYTCGIRRREEVERYPPGPARWLMEPLFLSTGVVAVAEMGDKTQLLALILAARYRKPLPIILGILVATLANHGLAAWLGALAASWLGPDLMRWILGAGFLAMAARFHALVLVTAGTTLGMMLVNVPAVLCGEGIARVAPMKLIHTLAAGTFAVLGIMTLLRIDFGLLGT